LAAATGALLRQHILVTRGHTLESLTHCTDVVFDKTGTLTEGRPEVIAVQPAAGHDAPTMLAWAARLEAGSAHPFARAIIGAAGGSGADDGATLLPEERIDEPGFGVAAQLRTGDGSVHRLVL